MCLWAYLSYLMVICSKPSVGIRLNHVGTNSPGNLSTYLPPPSVYWKNWEEKHWQWTLRYSSCALQFSSSGVITPLSQEKVKWSRYRPGVAQRVGRGIALLFHDRGTRRGWEISSTPRPYFTPGKEPVPILQEAGWVPGPVWTGGKSRSHRDLIPNRPARSHSLYRLRYLTHPLCQYVSI